MRTDELGVGARAPAPSPAVISPSVAEEGCAAGEEGWVAEEEGCVADEEGCATDGEGTAEEEDGAAEEDGWTAEGCAAEGCAAEGCAVEEADSTAPGSQLRALQYLNCQLRLACEVQPSCRFSLVTPTKAVVYHCLTRSLRLGTGVGSSSPLSRAPERRMVYNTSSPVCNEPTWMVA